MLPTTLLVETRVFDIWMSIHHFCHVITCCKKSPNIRSLPQIDSDVARWFFSFSVNMIAIFRTGASWCYHGHSYWHLSLTDTYLWSGFINNKPPFIILHGDWRETYVTPGLERPLHRVLLLLQHWPCLEVASSSLGTASIDGAQASDPKTLGIYFPGFIYLEGLDISKIGNSWL